MDKHVHITFKQALAAAIPGPDTTKIVPGNGYDGPVGGFFGPVTTENGLTGVTTKANLIDKIYKGTNAAADYVQVAIIIARPFIEHLMMSAVMTVAGRDTGATLFGPADMRALTPSRTPIF